MNYVPNLFDFTLLSWIFIDIDAHKSFTMKSVIAISTKINFSTLTYSDIDNNKLENMMNSIFFCAIFSFPQFCED